MIDTHCHLNLVEPLDEALLAAKAAGITGIIAVGEEYESNQKILEISQRNNPVKVYPAMGLHPGKVTSENLEKTLQQIEKNISKLIAIGESGLDFWISTSKKDNQKELQIESFKAQINIAKKHNLPISLHSRGAWPEALEIAQKEGAKKCIFHWYSGPLDALKDILDAGYYISATPALEYSPQHIEAIKNCPLDRILIETDSPVIFKPKTGPYRGQPTSLLNTLKALAAIKEKSESDTAKICYNTAKALFNI